MYLILFGMPGSGKGTQGQMLKEHFAIPHISTGDIFREAIKEKTPLGEKAKSFIDRGELVPDEIVTGIVKERIDKSDCEKGFVLDGFPRTVNQAESLDHCMGEKKKVITAVINYEITEAEALRRLLSRISCQKCGAVYNLIQSPPKAEMVCDRCGSEMKRRGDDTEEVINNRLKVYNAQTSPLLDYYGRKGLLTTIKAEAPVEKILKEVEGLLAEKSLK
jgi:adenylate kinase